MKTLCLVVGVFFGMVANGADVEAQNCEIFVDRIRVVSDDYGNRSIKLQVKTNLDAAIVGVRKQDKFRDIPTGIIDINEWKESTLSKNLDHSYSILLQLNNKYVKIDAEYVLFVQTKNGKRYWLHPEHNMGKNFSATFAEFDSILSGIVDTANLSVELPTQGSTRLMKYNPENCY